MKLRKKKSRIEKLSKRAQTKLNSFIPAKAHQAITEAIKLMVKTVLTGSEIVSRNAFPSAYTLEEKEKLLLQQLDKYRKAATVEGAGTGAGGFLLGMAD